jgi:hypothetical protein
MSPPQPLPLATLRLSHPSLLDAVLSADGTPLYSFETAHNQTSLLRCIPDSDSLEQVASVQWPLNSVPTTPRRKERETGVLVKMADAPLLPELDFLRVSTGVMHRHVVTTPHPPSAYQLTSNTAPESSTFPDSIAP